MQTTALIVTSVGAALSFAGSAWLLFGFSPDNPRYTNDGGLYPGQQVSTVVPNLLRDQRKASALTTLGATIQLVGAVLAVAAA